jgi:NAD+ diphosphatase
MTFKPGFKSTAANTSALWFIFRGGKLLTQKESGCFTVPETSDLAGSGFSSSCAQYLGSLDGRNCFTTESTDEFRPGENFEFRDLRSLFDVMERELLSIAGRANQLLHWDITHRYCGGCGRPTEDKPDERAKICTGCGLINYPRISPAVIVAVIREDRILLARNKQFRLPFFSVLAGFVEPGEKLEDCIEREIREEVGIRVRNIRYFGSQPWPFPNSLMIGFVAEHSEGEIRIDNSEIIEAGWFSRENLPAIPSKISIARQLIDWFIETPSPILPR